MWKTRFEVSTSKNNGLTRHRNLSSSSTIIHHYYSRPSPTVPRVRDDSPSAIVRPSPPSSISNLGILTEEDEDIPYSDLTPNLVSITLRKPNSYQTMNKHQIILPTIIESNDHEENKTDINMLSNESLDDKLATNTNYHQLINVDIERKERTLNINQNNEMTLDKRINELLQQKNPRENKCTSLSIEVDKTEISIPTTFKDISAFFENKTLVASTVNRSEQKKMVRAKRSLLLNRHIPLDNNDLPKLELISSTKKESTIFHHPLKRIKTTHTFELDSMAESELLVYDSIAKRSITFNNGRKTNAPKVMMNTSLNQTLPKRWFILLLLTMTMLYLSNLTNISKDTFQLNPFVYFQNSPSNVFPQQSKEPTPLINDNIISQYGQFVRNRFFALLDFLMTFIGQIFFRIDKYEYKTNIIYTVTSTYELIYDWFIHNIFR